MSVRNTVADTKEHSKRNTRAYKSEEGMSYKLSYGKTFNLGNYQSERYDLEYEFDDDVDPVEAIADMKARVREMYRVAPAEPKTCGHPAVNDEGGRKVCTACGEIVGAAN